MHSFPSHLSVPYLYCPCLLSSNLARVLDDQDKLTWHFAVHKNSSNSNTNTFIAILQPGGWIGTIKNVIK